MFEHGIGFWVNGVLACCCAVIGLLLNLTTIYILTLKKGLRNVFNRLLLCLCWFDNCVLTIWILARLYIDFEVRPNVFIWMFPYFTFPCGSIAQSASTFMTIALAHERYLAVSNPVKYNQSSLNPKSQTIRVLTYVISVVIFSIVYNIPFFLCFYIEEDEMTNILNVKVTDLRKDSMFVRYYINWTRFFVSGIIPFGTLFYYNFRFYKVIKKNSDRRRKLQVGGRTSNKKIEDKERNMAIVMFGIVAIFLICHR